MSRTLFAAFFLIWCGVIMAVYALVMIPVGSGVEARLPSAIFELRMMILPFFTQGSSL